MATRIIEVVAAEGLTDTLVEIGRKGDADDVIVSAVGADGRQTIRMVVGDCDQQALLDRIQSVVSASENWRVVIIPVEAMITAPSASGEVEKPAPVAGGLTREELYEQVGGGVHLNATYLLLVFLSTVVAAIGLAESNVAVVIGAMVIAPLLGPVLAFAFAVAIGERDLMLRSAATGIAGLAFSLAIGITVGVGWPIDFHNAEISSRTVVGFESIALALASGTAAALSLLTGLSSTLVGVMVAVALLPPTATLGMMIGSGDFDRATGAALLLGVNVVCVMFAAQLVFIVKGIRPRRWFDARQARRSALLNAAAWACLLAGLSAIVYLSDR